MVRIKNYLTNLRLFNIFKINSEIYNVFCKFLHLPVHALSCQSVKILGLTEPKAAWGGLKMVSQNCEDTVLPVMRLISSP